MREKRSSEFPIRSDTNWPAQSQKKSKSLKLWKYVEEEFYCPCSKNKGADHLCFCIVSYDVKLNFLVSKGKPFVNHFQNNYYANYQ